MNVVYLLYYLIYYSIIKQMYNNKNKILKYNIKWPKRLIKYKALLYIKTLRYYLPTNMLINKKYNQLL